MGEHVGAQAVHDLLADGVDIQVWTTPSTAVTTATATMPATSQTSRVRSWRGQGVVDDGRSRNGEAIATTDDATISAVTTATAQRWGRNSAAMRRQRDRELLELGLSAGSAGATAAAGR